MSQWDQGAVAMNAPLDALHAECLNARNEIRSMFDQAKAKASKWDMRSCPPQPIYVRPGRLPDAIYGDDPLLRAAWRWLR